MTTSDDCCRMAMCMRLFHNFIVNKDANVSFFEALLIAREIGGFIGLKRSKKLLC